MFKAFECSLLELCPHAGFPFASEQVKGGDNVREVRDEFPVKDLKPLLQKNICEDVVHESLEGGGSIAEPKEHDGGFKESHGGDKSGLPLILLSDANVVISPTNVEFDEQGRFFHVIDEFRDQGERMAFQTVWEFR